MPKIGELIDIKHGYAYKGKYIVREKNDNILVTPGNFYVGGGFKNEKNKYYVGESIEGYILKPNDIIIAMTDLSKETDILGYAARVPSDGCQYLHNQRIGLVTVKSKDLYPDYLYWVMRSKIYQKKVAATATGSTVKHTSPKLIKEINIEVPSLLRQKKIANLMNNIEQRIILNNKINNNLEQQAMVIFDYFFPNITYGDKVIGDTIIPKRGKNLLSKNAVFGKVPVVAGGLTPLTYHNISNTVAPVLAISASGANAGYVSLWDKPIWSSDSSYIDSSMTKDVYFWYVLLKKRQTEIYESQTGSAQPHIYPKHIASMPVCDLKSEEISNFTLLVTPIFSMIHNNKEESIQLSILRETLLPKLLFGELDVSNIDI